MKKRTKIQIERWAILLVGLAAVEVFVAPPVKELLQMLLLPCQNDGQAVAYGAIGGLVAGLIRLPPIIGFCVLRKQIEWEDILEGAKQEGLSPAQYCIKNLPKPYNLRVQSKIDAGEDITEYLKTLKKYGSCHKIMIQAIEYEYAKK